MKKLVCYTCERTAAAAAAAAGVVFLGESFLSPQGGAGDGSHGYSLRLIYGKLRYFCKSHVDV